MTSLRLSGKIIIVIGAAFIILGCLSVGMAVDLIDINSAPSLIAIPFFLIWMAGLSMGGLLGAFLSSVLIPLLIGGILVKVGSGMKK